MYIYNRKRELYLLGVGEHDATDASSYQEKGIGHFEPGIGAAWISQSRQSGIDTEIVERRQYRVAISLGGLLVVFG